MVLVGMRVSLAVTSNPGPARAYFCLELWNMLRGTKLRMLSKLSATKTSWAAWST